MARGAYIGVGGTAKKIKKIYFGVGGVAKKVKKAYIGVGGVAKLWWQSEKTLIKQADRAMVANRSQVCWNPSYAIFCQTSSSDATRSQTVNPSLTISAMTTANGLNYDSGYMNGGQVGDYAVLWGGQYHDQDEDSYQNSKAYCWNRSLQRTILDSASYRNNYSICCSCGNYMYIIGGENVTGSSTASYKGVRSINGSLTVNSGLPDVSEGGAYIGGANSAYALFFRRFRGSGFSSSTCVAYNNSGTQHTGTVSPTTTYYGSVVCGNRNHILVGAGQSGSTYRSIINTYDTSLTKGLADPLQSARSITVEDDRQYASIDDMAVIVGSGTDIDVYDDSLVHTTPDALTNGTCALAPIGAYIVCAPKANGVASIYKIDA